MEAAEVAAVLGEEEEGGSAVIHAGRLLCRPLPLPGAASGGGATLPAPVVSVIAIAPFLLLLLLLLCRTSEARFERKASAKTLLGTVFLSTARGDDTGTDVGAGRAGIGAGADTDTVVSCCPSSATPLALFDKGGSSTARALPRCAEA